jgi:sugar lactone lactonase YvrE
MLSRRLNTILVALLAGPCAAALPACDSAGPASAEHRTGALRMPLVATTNGHTYRLRQATFTIAGPTSVVLDSETQPDADGLSASLASGSYTVTLSGPWFLERLDAGGPVRVDATLTSPNPATFDVTAGVTASVFFAFSTDGIAVATGPGGVTLGTTVTSTGNLSLLAGHLGDSGTTDGTGVFARFEDPAGVATDGAGNLFVADTVASTIRQVVLATGQVTTLAGTASAPGTADGVGAAARFGDPEGVVADGAGNLYVADTGGETIRKIVVATGQVTTIAGSPGVFGSADGVGAAAQFGAPVGIAADDAGNLYVADSENNTIRKVVIATGQVTTFAGKAGDFGPSVDGTGPAAVFSRPMGLALDHAGNLYVSDQFDGTIRKIVLATADVTTIAGTHSTFGSADGVGAAASFNLPWGLALDGAGDLFVADNGNSTIREIALASAQVTTVAGQVGLFGGEDGTGPAALFAFPEGLAADALGNVYVADTNFSTIRKILVGTADVSTIAGSPPASGTADGVGSAARFAGPSGLRSDGSGILYACDTGGDTVRRIVVATGEVTTIAGAPGQSGSDDGVGPAARFNGPWGVAPDGSGNVFIADSLNGTIRKLVPSTGEVTTIAGAAGQEGSSDGVGGAARFDLPEGIALDAAGDLFIADFSNSTIRKLVLATGEVTTIAGVPGVFEVLDGTGAGAHFHGPSGVAVDGGNLYVADEEGAAIRKVVIATGEVTTLAGLGDHFGSADGVGSAARFEFPSDLVTDGVGNLFVADHLAHTIRKIVIATAEVTTVVGTPSTTGVLFGALPASLNQPQTLTLLPSGDLAIADENSILVAQF